MTDRIEKALGKLSAKERKKIAEILGLIRTGRLDGLDIKKLKGRDDIFRARKGDVRVIFRRTTDGTLFVLAVERRTSTTYRGY